MGILCRQADPAQTLQFWVEEGRLHERFSETTATVGLKYKHVAEPRVRGVVRDRSD